MVLSVGSSFASRARWVVLSPPYGVSMGYISQTWVQNMRRFFLIVLRTEFSSRRTKFPASRCDSFCMLCSIYLEYSSIFSCKVWTSEMILRLTVGVLLLSRVEFISVICLSKASSLLHKSTLMLTMVAKGCSWSLLIIVTSLVYPPFSSAKLLGQNKVRLFVILRKQK